MMSPSAVLRQLAAALGRRLPWAILLALVPVAAAAVALQWQSGTFVARVGTLLSAGPGEAARLRLDSSGLGVIELPSANVPLDRLSRFSLTLGADAPPLDVRVIWWLRVGEELASLPLEHRGRRYRAELAASADWPDAINAFALRIAGAPGATVPIVSMELSTPAGWRGLAGMFRAAWQARPWNQVSINVHNWRYASWSGLPLVAWLGLLALVLALVASRWRAGPRGAWLAVAVIVPAWLLLDALWLRQLALRAGDTVATFRGLDEAQALAASSDGSLVARVRRLEPFLSGRDRVFVATRGDYVGMRTAYYLYPHNVYWQRHGPELPAPSDLVAGDKVLVLAPSALQVDREEGLLLWPGGRQRRSVAVLAADDRSMLLVVRGGG